MESDVAREEAKVDESTVGVAVVAAGDGVEVAGVASVDGGFEVESSVAVVPATK